MRNPPGTVDGNLVRSILSSNRTPATIAEGSVNGSQAPSDVIQVGDTYYGRINANPTNRRLNAHFVQSDTTNRRLNAHFVQYDLSQHHTSPVTSSLVDGGANGGMTGADVRILSTSDFHRANVSGIGDATISDLPLVTAAGVVDTHRGPAIAILHQYAHYGKGNTIHSSAQMRDFGIEVHDAPRRHGGQQRLITPDGYHIPLSYRDGLPILAMRPPTDDELSSLPHLLLTSDVPWIPSCLDDDFTCDEIVAPIDSGGLDLDPRVTDHGAYTGNLQDDIDIILHECRQTRSNNQTVTPSKPDLEALRPLFGWVPVDRIKKTIASTTQFARASVRLPLRKHLKSRFPARNVHRWHEDVATDTFFCHTPA